MLKKPKTNWKTEGNLASSSDGSQAPEPSVKRPTLRLIQGLRGRLGPFDEPGFRFRQLIVAIAVSLTLCLLWVLVVFLLYRIARTVLAL
jgi:hypothetical protein